MRALLAITSLLTFQPLHADFTNDDWHAIPGINSGDQYEVRTVATDSAGNLYVAGNFTSVGGVPATDIARWDGSAWHAMGAQLDSANGIYSLACHGTEVYAGGEFEGCVAKWNGSTWTTLTGSNGVEIWDAPTAMAFIGGKLHAAAYFSGGIEGIARWEEGSGWQIIGDTESGHILCIAPADDGLYVGGRFTSINGVAANRVAKWNGASWNALGDGMSYDDGTCRVRTLAYRNGSLYAGGTFDTAGGVSAPCVAKWDGQTWHPMPFGYSLDTVRSLHFVGDQLFMAAVGFIPSSHTVTRWDGVSWQPLGSGIPGTVRTMTSHYHSLFAGGDFYMAGNTPTYSLAMADLSDFSIPLYPLTVQAAGLAGADAATNARPFGDGVPNLVKFAFNMDLSKADCHSMDVGGISGLPRFGRSAAASGMFEFEYVRRIGGGLVYTPESSGDLTEEWSGMTEPPQVAPINPAWERVIHHIPTTQEKRFHRVRVELQP